jgi:cytidine deaminase
MEPALVQRLDAAAREAARNAYAPASGFGVGAALLAADGRVFTGCNVENASYGLTICAERSAVAQAVAAGARAFLAIVVFTPLAEPGTPCGACRQVLAEFAPELRVRLIGTGARAVETDLGRLLPSPFRFHRDIPK